MRISIKRNLLFISLLAFSSAPIVAGESLWSSSEWPDPDNLQPITVVALSVVALAIGHTSAIGLECYWKKNKKAFGVLSAATATGLGVLAYTSLVNANLETRSITFSTFGLGAITALISSSIGIIWNRHIKDEK